MIEFNFFYFANDGSLKFDASKVNGTDAEKLVGSYNSYDSSNSSSYCSDCSSSFY